MPTIKNVPYSDIPRLAKEGKIKVGTRVRACEDQNQFPNPCSQLDHGEEKKITKIIYNSFKINGCHHVSSDVCFLDILPDEDDLISVEKKPLSFDEPLTIEAVGKVIVNEGGDKRTILEVGMSGNTFLVSKTKYYQSSNGFWWTREDANRGGWRFEDSEPEISIEEAEKLTGKKIKR